MLDEETQKVMEDTEDLASFFPSMQAQVAFSIAYCYFPISSLKKLDLVPNHD